MTRQRNAATAVLGPRGCRGVAAVEFAIVVPILLLAMLACAEIGRAFVHYHTLSYATRNCARYLSEHAINGTTGVVVISPETAARVRNLAVYGNEGGTGRRVLPNFQATHVNVSSSGNVVQVAVDYPYQPMIGAVLPTFGAGDNIGLEFHMHVTVDMRAIA